MVERIWRYCERGVVAGWTAEPFNLASNLAFLLVAWLIVRTARRPDARLIGSGAGAVFAGSTLFHGTAWRVAEIADVVPIGVLMALLGWRVLVETIGLTHRTACLALGAVGLAVAGLVVVLNVTGCAMPQVVAGRLTPMAGACLNGSWLYVPPALALVASSAVAWRRKATGSPWLLAAAGVFLVALVVRSLDLQVCNNGPGPGPTLHALWHVHAAATIYLLWRTLPAAGVGGPVGVTQAGRARPKGR